MRVLRFISAFVFAVIVAASVVAFLWYSKVTQFEQELQNKLTYLTGGQVTYSALVRSMNPTEFRVLLKDVVYKIEDVQSGHNIQYFVGDVHIVSDLLGQGDLSIKLGKHQSIEAVHRGVTRHFDIKMKNGEIALYRKIETASQLFSADDVTLTDKQTGAVLLTLKNPYLSYTDGVSEGALWEIAASDINILEDVVTDLSFVWSFDHTQQTSLAHFLSAILLEDKDNIDQILADYIHYAAINESFIHVKGASFKLDDFWLTFNGGIGVGKDYSFYPYGAMSFTTNNLELVLDRLRTGNYIKNIPLKQHRMLTRMMLQKRSSYNVNVGVNRGALLLNGAPSGDAPFMGNILNISHLLELKE